MWMIKALKLISAATNVIALLKSTIVDWKTKLISCCINPYEVNVNQGIFQGDSFITFAFCYITDFVLSLVLRWMKQEYSFQNGKINLNHLLFMDDLKLYGSNQNEVDSYVGIVEIITTDIRMKFGIN